MLLEPRTLIMIRKAAATSLGGKKSYPIRHIRLQLVISV